MKSFVESQFQLSARKANIITFLISEVEQSPLYRPFLTGLAFYFFGMSVGKYSRNVNLFRTVRHRRWPAESPVDSYETEKTYIRLKYCFVTRTVYQVSQYFLSGFKLHLRPKTRRRFSKSKFSFGIVREGNN